MTEKGFEEMLKNEGYIFEGHPRLTWEQVETECKRIDAKKSALSSDSRKVFLFLRSMKEQNISLPSFVQPTDPYVKSFSDGALNITSGKKPSNVSE